MVLISHKYKFIYIKTKKTGSTTTENFFSRFCLDNEEDYIDKHSHDYYEGKNGIIGQRILGKHGKNGKYNVNTKLKDINLKKYNDYFIFTTIRNVYDRLISLFYFLKFLKEKKIAPAVWLNPQFHKLIVNNEQNLDDIKLFRLFIKKFINELENGCWEEYLINNKPSCDYYIKQERLEDDIKIVCKKLNINYDKYKLVSFKRGYRKSKKNVKEYYDEETKNLVYQRFKEEIDYWNYKL